MRKKTVEKYEDIIEPESREEDILRLKTPPICKNCFIALTREDFSPAVLIVSRIRSLQSLEEGLANKSKIQRRQARPGKTRIDYDGKEIIVQEQCMEVLGRMKHIITDKLLRESENWVESGGE